MQQGFQMPVQGSLIQVATENVKYILTHLVKLYVQILLQGFILEHVSLEIFNAAHVQKASID